MLARLRGWFYARLLLTGRICRGGDPVMEDWGWTFAVAGSLLTWRIDLPCWPAAAA